MKIVKYPKFKYHQDKDAVIVKDEAAEKALGQGWVDSPAEFKEVKKPVKEVKAEKKLFEEVKASPVKKKAKAKK